MNPLHSSQRIPELDGIRGLAILLVLLGHHFGSMQPAPDSLWRYVLQALYGTWSGVDLFYVLSGFLIGGILLDHREATNYYHVFYLRRAGRIFPLYYLNLALFYGLILAGASHFSPWLFDKPLPFLSYATFTQNFFAVWAVATIGFPAVWMGPTGTLAVEEQFYWTIPLVIRHCATRWLPGLLISVIVSMPLLRVLGFLYLPAGGIANYNLLRADALMFGILVAYLLRQPAVIERIESHRRWLVIGIVMLGGGFVLLNALKPLLLVSDSWLMATIGYTWIDLFYTLLLVLVVTKQQSLLASFFRLSWLRQLGVISYCVYLIHLPVLGLMHAAAFANALRISNAQELIVTLASLVTTLLLATLSWRWLEQPILRWCRSFEYKSEDNRKVAVTSGTTSHELS